MPLPKTVFESVVGGSRKYEVAAAQVLDVSEALELRCIDDLDAERMEFDVTVDWVVEYLLRKLKYISQIKIINNFKEDLNNLHPSHCYDADPSPLQFKNNKYQQHMRAASSSMEWNSEVKGKSFDKSVKLRLI